MTSTDYNIPAEAVTAADGVRLPLRSWLPDSEPEAVLLALHGFNDYSYSFEGAGPHWSGLGLAVYAYDQRGFGAAPDPGVWPGTGALTDDLVQAAAQVRSRHPGLPFFLVGESMGGAVVMAALGQDLLNDVDGIILVAPAIWGRATMNPFYRVALHLGMVNVPEMTVTNRWLKIKPSDNLEVLDQLEKDPLVIHETRIDALHGMVNLMDEALKAAPGIDEPLLILYGHNDEIIPRKATGVMLGKLKGEPLIALYPDGYHLLLRDLQAKVVMDDVAAWVMDQEAVLPSGAEAEADALFD